MKRSALVSLALVVGSVGSLVFAGACSSGGGGATSDGGTTSSSGSSGGGSDGGDAGTCPYTPDADLTTPMVSFASQIKPVFAASCGIAGGTCHGNPQNSMMGLFLGSPDGGTDPATIVNGIVDKPTTEEPQMDIVKAGDPDHSYLVHKMIGDQGMFDSECAKSNTSLNPPCGLSMPWGNGCIDMTPATIDTVRRWIAQGAKNN